ncbi:methyltransferase [Parashewanella tropica]|uniref:methyltransferase n=1 Tax=Parashewanella tropica TaxID=2547970 RepID=UPI001059FC74|nr:methyltransferase [Parashewanella tropica]
MFEQYFQKLCRLLIQSKPLWQVASFEHESLPWEHDFPTLAEAVWSLTEDEIEHLDADHDLLIESVLPSLNKDIENQQQSWDYELLCFPSTKVVNENHHHDYPSRLSSGVKGRKWQQITRFSDAAISESDQSQHSFLEWCSGKGHLGRLLAFRTQSKVTSLEWQAELSRQGQVLSDKFKLKHQHICGDAFTDGAELLKTNQHAIALHACGDLHVELIKQASKVGTEAISIAPCCYHLIRTDKYQPLSEQGKASGLELSKADLRLPLQQSVIANEVKNKQRLKEMAWRLGFDSLQRAVRQQNSYLPVPSIKQSQLAGSFKAFCIWAAEQKQVTLPDSIDFNSFEKQGVQRQKLTRRIDLVAHIFRQAIESWLLLDRCLLLEQQGYRVELVDFCPSHITPRNKLIRANR